MLEVYLYTLIIGHKSRNMLSILNKLTVQKDLQNCVKTMCFLTKIKTTATQKIKHITIAGAGN